MRLRAALRNPQPGTPAPSTSGGLAPGGGEGAEGSEPVCAHVAMGAQAAVSSSGDTCTAVAGETPLEVAGEFAHGSEPVCAQAAAEQAVSSSGDTGTAVPEGNVVRASGAAFVPGLDVVVSCGSSD